MKKSSEIDWKSCLTPEQYTVCREKGTERAFSGEYWNCKDEGTYTCVCCGNSLFSSKDKFDSGTGWPSFTRPLESESVGSEEDRSHSMARIEVHCNQCGSHLGHVFPDGPAPTGKRYCINSVALKIERKG